MNMIDQTLISIRSAGFKKVKQALSEHGFEWKGSQDYQLFASDKCLLRLEEFNDGYLNISASPKSVFDRWANSRHFMFGVYIYMRTQHLREDDTTHIKTTHNTTNHICAVMHDRINAMNDLIKRIPRRYFHNGISISL